MYIRRYCFTAFEFVIALTQMSGIMCPPECFVCNGEHMWGEGTQALAQVLPNNRHSANNKLHCNENPIYVFPEKELCTVQSQSQFPHLFVCERLIYSQDLSTHFPASE
jgi:hypothetical protein